YAIICYDCHSDQGTCNEGECEGVVCIKMETSNKDNGTNNYLKRVTDIGGLFKKAVATNTKKSHANSRGSAASGCRAVSATVRCAMGIRFVKANVEEDEFSDISDRFCSMIAESQALIDAGLEPSSAAPPPGHFTQFALLVAILVFVGASCSLIVIATICVQFC
ncbi:hypothetical protein GCK32_003292, partial [Trichostrongylus colubriformis]